MKWIKLYSTKISHCIDNRNENLTLCRISLFGPYTNKNIPDKHQQQCKRCLKQIEMEEKKK